MSGELHPVQCSVLGHVLVINTYLSPCTSIYRTSNLINFDLVIDNDIISTVWYVLSCLFYFVANLCSLAHVLCPRVIVRNSQKV